MIISVLLFCASPLLAQKELGSISKGNEAYKQQQYQEAVNAYRKALEQSPKNTIASFNLGNALFRSKNYEDSEKNFDETIMNSDNKKMAGDAWYNKGVSFTNQKKLLESIEAYKNALRINPNDILARENLQRAINELKRQQEQQNQQQKQQNKLTKQQVQQMLLALQEQEKNLQQKLHKSKVPSPGQPDKDW